jgi:hypothetical protein
LKAAGQQFRCVVEIEVEVEGEVVLTMLAAEPGFDASLDARRWVWVEDRNRSVYVWVRRQRQKQKQKRIENQNQRGLVLLACAFEASLCDPLDSKTVSSRSLMGRKFS